MQKALSAMVHRTRYGAVVSVVLLALFATACTSINDPTPPVSAATPTSTNFEPTPDALDFTATLGKDLLPPGKPGIGKPPVVLGSKNFPEQDLLGQLYAQALIAKGYTVTIRANIGSSEVIDASLVSGQIQMYPEYLGEIVVSVAKQPGPASASDTYMKAKNFEEQRRGATILKQTPFQDTDAIAVTALTAQQHDLNTISDINKMAPGGEGMTIGATPDFSARQAGLIGLKQRYNLTKLGFTPVPPGRQYDLLDSGAVQMVDAFTTDAALQSGKYRVLTDPKNIFGFQYVAPIIDKRMLAEEGPEFAATCNWVSSLLDTQTIHALTGEVQTNVIDAASVAQQFLTANNVNGAR